MSKQNFFNFSTTLISVIAAVFVLLKVTPFSVNGDTFIGVIAAFIAIIVTLHIGFQIIKYLEIKEELKEIKKTKKEIVETQKRIAIIENKSQENYYTLLAKSISDASEKCVEIFLIQLEALVYALRAEQNDFDDIFYSLRTYITKIQYGPICRGSNIDQDKALAEYIAKAEKINFQIKAFDNYSSIKYGYEPIMKLFYNRLKKLRNLETVSEEEYNEIMNR